MSENRARKRWARGVCSEQRAWRSDGIGSVDAGCGDAWERASVSAVGAVEGDFVIGGGLMSGNGIAVGAMICRGVVAL